MIVFVWGFVFVVLFMLGIILASIPLILVGVAWSVIFVLIGFVFVCINSLKVDQAKKVLSRFKQSYLNKPPYDQYVLDCRLRATAEEYIRDPNTNRPYIVVMCQYPNAEEIIFPKYFEGHFVAVKTQRGTPYPHPYFSSTRS